MGKPNKGGESLGGAVIIDMSTLSKDGEWTQKDSLKGGRLEYGGVKKKKRSTAP